jgi:NAD+ diphosphatase
VPDISLSLISPAATPDSLLFLVDGSKVWLLAGTNGPVVPRLSDIPQAEGALFHIGRLQNADCFSITHHTGEFVLPQTGDWWSLRQLFLVLDEDLFAMVGRAAQLASWQREHAFCGQCGTACKRHEREFAMVCGRCGFHQYPTINPCVIVLVTRENKALLAQGARFPEGLFSCLAGFIEAGESAEQAVRREVLEEVGIRLGSVSYQGSQPWPFPHSLMLGYRAEWQEGEIEPDMSEIARAGWFTPETLPKLPMSGSIARTLIDVWLEGN